MLELDNTSFNVNNSMTKNLSSVSYIQLKELSVKKNQWESSLQQCLQMKTLKVRAINKQIRSIFPHIVETGENQISLQKESNVQMEKTQMVYPTIIQPEKAHFSHQNSKDQHFNHSNYYE